ncbi:uncharacterized protein CDAR_429841 [Caerostris darwini]|uniref:Uncharacterized protein n=1 Tax=Caerostris darwini TaxID=1538125 RepID=A0AAV4VVY4_9ARAC|nr:uncharacterized protein CDAR_429841 [Caerostris darwini]
MKSAAASKAALHSTPLSATSPLSHIPLPRRKNSSKGDKGLDVDDTDSEYSNDAVATRSQAKMSLLGSTSFCCASGQKEDYIPDARILPASKPPKKRPPNISVKKECDPSTPRTPLLNAGKGLLAKNKKGKLQQDNAEVSDVQVHSNEKLSVKSNLEEIKTRPAIHEIDTRLRPPEERRKITPPSPQRRIMHREPPLALRKDHPDIRKYTDGMRKLRSAALPNQSIEITNANANKCKHANEKLQNLPTDPEEKDDDGFMASATVDSNACTVNQGDLGMKETLVQNGHSGNMIDCGENMNKSHESEDFDCPCCDRNSIMMDETGLSDIEVKMFTSCDVIAPVEETLNELKDVKEDCDNKNNYINKILFSLDSRMYFAASEEIFISLAENIPRSLHNLQLFAINVLPPSGIPHKTLSVGHIPNSGHSPDEILLSPSEFSPSSEEISFLQGDKKLSNR